MLVYDHMPGCYLFRHEVQASLRCLDPNVPVSEQHSGEYGRCCWYPSHCLWPVEFTEDAHVFYLDLLPFYLTLIMSEVAFISNATKWPNINRLAALDGDWPSSCGGQPPPLRWCANQHFMHLLTIPQKWFGYVLDPICFVIYVLCLVEWLFPRLCKWIRFDSIVKKSPALTRLSCASQRFRESKSWWFVYGYRFLLTAVEVLLLAASVVYVVLFVMIADAGTIDLSGWSFGQILAITIWAPVIGKYVYWTMCEFTNSFRPLWIRY